MNRQKVVMDLVFGGEGALSSVMAERADVVAEALGHGVIAKEGEESRLHVRVNDIRTGKGIDIFYL